MRAAEFSGEKPSTGGSEHIDGFMQFCQQELELSELPSIKFVTKADGGDRETFGRFDLDDDSIEVQLADRHIADVFRTLAHELVHYKQRLTQKELDGETGSDDENEANAEAAVIMRNYADKNPQIFEN